MTIDKQTTDGIRKVMVKNNLSFAFSQIWWAK